MKLKLLREIVKRNTHLWFAQDYTPKKKKPAAKRTAQQVATGRATKLAAQDAFKAKCSRYGLPAPVCELRFDARKDAEGKRLRQWPFDYCWPALGIAIEVEGGIWQVGADGKQGGRHNRPKGMLGDMEKYNEAAVQGWILLRTVPDDIKRREPRILAEVAKAVQYRQDNTAPGYDTR